MGFQRIAQFDEIIKKAEKNPAILDTLTYSQLDMLKEYMFQLKMHLLFGEF